MPPVHDYVIDNSTGANVRQDINNALAAIVSNNSSSSQPTTRYAYMWWADTTTGILKIRNSANDGWVELFQLDGTLTLEDGSASTPALAFRDNLNTGIFSSGADKLNIATGGVERIEFGTGELVVNEDGANCDFRVEGDTAVNLLFCDAGNDRVGIRTNSPAVSLEVEGVTKSNSTVNSGVSTAIRTENAGTGTTQASIGFASSNSQKASIRANVLGAGDMFFHNNNDSVKMTLLAGGNLGLGTTSPAARLHLDMGAGGLPAIRLQHSSSGNDTFEITGGLTGVSNSGFGIRDVDANAYRLAINSSGDIGISENSPSARLHVSGGNGLLVERSAGTSIAGFKHSGSSSMNIYLQNTGSTNHPSVGSENQDLTIGTNNSNRIKVNSAGDTVILAVNVYEGGRSLDINSTSSWSTFFTFSNDQANAFVARFTATENNNTTGYIVLGSVVGNQIVQSFMNDTNHAHSKDVLFQLAGTGNTQLQVKASQFTTTRRVRLIDIFVSAGRPTYA
tara:strand:- start:1144 stop:2664 length:1521 start_codon:yes stop_codon:yes gene_type:complete